MPKILFKTKRNTEPIGKPRVYFTCHPEDFELYFEQICQDIFVTHDCVVFYTDDMSVPIPDVDRITDLEHQNLFVVPVTHRLLTECSRAMDDDIPYAKEKNIPILPIVMETGLDELYAQPDKFGELQYLRVGSNDETEIAYPAKLKKYLESVLISDEVAQRIRSAFDAYIFLSYRKKDRRYANELMRLIHRYPRFRDIAIWYDEFLTPGESFRENIEKVLANSKLFALLVTPNLLEEPGGMPNFVMGREYPTAQAQGINILPAQMEETDEVLLTEKFRDLPPRVDPHDEEAFHARLLSSIEKVAIAANDQESVHNFLIGLAYLDGIDVEVDRQRAKELITDAAENNLPEAMEKLIRMYTDGDGVPQNPALALRWSDRLSSYYFQEMFPDKNIVPDVESLRELFAHYRNHYWTDVIRLFLLRADQELADIRNLYTQIFSLGIQEYTLLLNASKEMICHQVETQRLLTADILEKSVDGTYPPYGPLFWYVPEYNLYESLVYCLDGIKAQKSLAKAMALTRDVCFLYDRKTALSQVTSQVDGASLYARAKPALHGVRDDLCRIFYLGSTHATCGRDVYPRCFNPEESLSFARYGCGIYGIMTTPFEDELGLFSHQSYNLLADEYIGFISCPYGPEAEKILRKKSCAKLRAVAFSSGTDSIMGRFALFGGKIRRIYLPEKATDSTWEWNYRFGEACEVVNRKGEKMYVSKEINYPYDRPELPQDIFYTCSHIETVTIPREMKRIGKSAFSKCTSLQQVILHEELTHIGDHAFMECTALTNLFLPDSIQDLGHYTFSGCTSLKYLHLPPMIVDLGDCVLHSCSSLAMLELPGGIRRIGRGALANCTALVDIVFPDGLIELGESAFADCRSLVQITIPNSVTNVGNNVFGNCESLVSVTLPQGLTALPEKLLAGCERLETISIPVGVEIVGDYTFSSCSSLKMVHLPDSVRALGWGAFRDCKKLSVVRLGNRISWIPMSCFESCTALTDVALPAELEAIGEGAFRGCAQLRHIQFPDTLAIVEKDAFCGCTAMEKVSIPDVTVVYPSAFEQHILIIQRPVSGTRLTLEIPQDTRIIPADAYKDRNDIWSVTAGNNLKQIGANAFANCINLREAILPGIVDEIPTRLFFGCANLKKVTLPQIMNSQEFPAKRFFRLRDLLAPKKNTVREIKIGRSSFESCESLKTIRIPDGIETLCTHAFRDCSSLTEVFIPDSVIRIEDGVFENCTSLSAITLPQGLIKVCLSSFRDCRSLTQLNLPQGLETIEAWAFSGCTALKYICLPDTVTSLEPESFSYCTSLCQVSLPKRLSVLGEYAFRNCTALTTVDLPQGLKELRQSAFYECKALVEVTIPEGITYLGEGVFSGCESLIKCTLPADLSRLPSGFFSWCKNLTDMNLPEGLSAMGPAAFELCTSLSTIDLPKELTVLEEMMFCDCTALKTIQFPQKLTTIKGSAFLRCSALEEISLPPSLEVIEQYAFYECTGLTRVEIPNNVQWIGKEAFSGCTGIQELWIPARFEQDLSDIFKDVDLSHVDITYL